MTQNIKWTLDRNLSVGLIAAVLFQAGAFIWYGAKLDSRVLALETSSSAASEERQAIKAMVIEKNDKLSGKVDEIGERVVRIETKLDFIVPAPKQTDGGK